MKHITLFTLFISPIVLNAVGDGLLIDALIPYDDDGFYGGSIIILFIIYISIPLFITVAVGSLIAYFIFPKILKEFQLLIELYYENKLVQGAKRHLIHFFIFTTFVLIFIIILQMFHISYLYLFVTLIFSYSSFFGFYILLYTLMALYRKNIQKVIIGLFLGGGIFLFFAPSGYYLFLPIYNFFNGTEKIEKHTIAEVKHSVGYYC